MGHTRRKGGKEAEHKTTFSYRKAQKATRNPAGISSGNKTEYVPGVTPIQAPIAKLPAKQPHIQPARPNTIVPKVTALDTSDTSSIETGTVKFFNTDTTKLFGFVTTDLPNQDGKPELFFHLGGGCEFIPVGKDKIDMIFVPYSDGIGITPPPKTGDKVVFIRGFGAKGEKIVKWGYQHELQDAITDCTGFITPTYRLVKEVRTVGNRISTRHILWEGEDLGDLCKKFPMRRGSEFKVGLTQNGEGTTKVFFELMEAEASDHVIDNVITRVPASWEQCEDPREKFLQRK